MDKYKQWIKEKLKSSQTTFEDNEEDEKSRFEIEKINAKFIKNKCTKDDYKTILFHL
jgi:hypothetical protein